MNPPLNRQFCLGLVLAIGQLLGVELIALAQAPASVVASEVNVPRPITLRCPVEFFRELLAMEPQEQEKALVNRANRKEILAKIAEYQALRERDPNQCELKLKATELRWYLQRVMEVPAAGRPGLLAGVPEKDRKLVEVRLRYWESLPVAVQRQLQTNEIARGYFSLPPEQRNPEAPMPTDPLFLMPGEQRQKILASFARFFDFTSEEQERVLRTLSEPERQQIEKTLKHFEQFSPARRADCVHWFGKFENLTPEERQQFLKNAERWKVMTPAERQEWKNLVGTLAIMPPFTPDLDLPPLPTSSPGPLQSLKP
jgi:hypothetical protein